jgi:hypothetical protein
MKARGTFTVSGAREQPAKSSAGPQLLAYQRQRIGERRTSLVVPGRSTDGARAFLGHLSVSEECHQGEKAQQCRSGAPDSLITAYCDDIEPGDAMDALRRPRVPKTGEIAPTVEREGH